MTWWWRLIISISQVHKLIPTLNKKEKYVLHYRNLQLYTDLGWKVKKGHRVLEFLKSVALIKTMYKLQHSEKNSPCEGLTMLSWPTMVNHGSTMVGNVRAGDTDHGYWPWSDHVNMVMPWHCFYPFNSNILTKKCLKMSVGDLSYGTFCFSLWRILFVVLDCWPWLTMSCIDIQLLR